MKVEFFVDRVVQDEHAGTDKEVQFVAGKIYDLIESSAARWISRGIAKEVIEAKAETKPKARARKPKTADAE